jgi:type I restriction enzyme S subunit
VIKEDEKPFKLPDSWAWCRLGNLCNYGSSPKIDSNKLSNDMWILDLKDIEKESSRLIRKVKFSERKTASSKSLFYKGNVLYSKLRPYLDKVIVADEDGACTTEILPLSFYGNINSIYSKYTFKRKDFLSYVNNLTKGVKMPRLVTKDGKMALYPLPPIAEQKQIVKKVEKLFSICDKLQTQITANKIRSEQLMQAVLKEAFTQSDTQAETRAETQANI